MENTPTNETEAKNYLSKLLQVIYVMAPALAEILLWIPYHFDENSEHVAYATDRGMYFGKAFWKYEAKQQAWILLHEAWHVALRHVDRRVALRAHPLISNMAMDVLINEGLKEVVYRQLSTGRTWLEMPPDALDVRWLQEKAQVKLEKNWSEYDWYELYLKLLKDLPRAKPGEEGIVVDSSYLNDLGGEGETLKAPDNFEGDLKKDEHPHDANESENEEVKEQLWRSRIRQAQAGDRSGSLITPFLGMMAKEKEIPWHRLYKRYLLNWSVRHQKELTFARPHRRYLSGVQPFMQPSQVYSAGLLPVTIIFDTSGSVRDEDLEIFAQHTDDFRKTFDLEMEMWVVMVDCEVQSCTKLEPGKTLLSYLKQDKVQFKGRGGTSFVPGLMKAKELRTKLCVYFTDLEGDFGKRPSGMDVLWVTTTDLKPPFGRCIHINTQD